MRMFSVLALAGAAMSGCTAGRVPSPAPFSPIASVRQVMDAITVPASDRVWAAAAEEIVTPEEWLDVEHAALALAESGNLLLMEGRALDRDAWAAESLRLVQAASAAADAARDRDADALASAGDAIYESCLSCHQLYMHRLHEEP